MFCQFRRETDRREHQNPVNPVNPVKILKQTWETAMVGWGKPEVGGRNSGKDRGLMPLIRTDVMQILLGDKYVADFYDRESEGEVA